jgi:hypothetical protein
MEDDVELQRLHDTYESGHLLTGELKKIAIHELWSYVSKFQQRRAQVTEQTLRIFMDGNRPLRLGARYNWADKVLLPRYHTEQEKKFVPTPTKFPLFPEGLLAAIISYVPLERAQVILYKNGDIDPRIVMTEVELYHTNAQTKAFYIGVLKGDGSSIETFTDVTEGEKRVAELEAMKEGEIVVVNGFK